jgi:hypothetical protein
MDEGDSQLHTLSVLEQLREASKGLWGASSAAYFRVDELLRQLANPNLHDIPRNLPALDAAISNYPDQRFTLRNGILVIRQHPRSQGALPIRNYNSTQIAKWRSASLSTYDASWRW